SGPDRNIDGGHRRHDRGRNPIAFAAERLAWIAATVALTACGFLYLSGLAGERRELTRFAALRAAGQLEATHPDLTLWSPQRPQAWRDTLVGKGPPPLAVLRIPRIRLQVPILEGTDDWTLNRAVGHIADTASPGTDGNCGIAGHR